MDSFFWVKHHRLPILPTRRQSTSCSTWYYFATIQNVTFCNTPEQPLQENKALSKSDNENEVYRNFLTEVAFNLSISSNLHLFYLQLF